MRLMFSVLGAGALIAASLPGWAVAPSHGEENARIFESALRAEAERQGVELPEFSSLVAEGLVLDLADGSLRAERIPFDKLLQRIGDLPAGSLASAGPAGTPVTGVGNNAHGYAAERIGDCEPRGYYSGFATSVALPGPTTIPNPAFPIVPTATATVWGGPAFYVTGGDWLLGAHAFLGEPLDVNVNTAGSTGPVPATTALSLGFDESIEAAGVGEIGMFSVAVTFFGFCLGSLDAGYILENGELAVDGSWVP